MKLIKLAGLTAAVLAAFLVSGCSGSSSEMTSQAEPAPVSEAAETYDQAPRASDEGSGLKYGQGDQSQPTQREELEDEDLLRIVYTVDMELQTTDFDQALDTVIDTTSELEGFVQDSYIDGKDINDHSSKRYAQFTLRVPAEHLETFLRTMKDNFNIVQQVQSSDDVSAPYTDTEARLSSLTAQEERLMALLKNAKRLDDILEIEQALANVRYEIEYYQSSLSRMGNQSSLCTITMVLLEVEEYDDVPPPATTFGERLVRNVGPAWSGFLRIVQGLLIFVLSALPYLLIVGGILFAAFKIHRRWKKNRDNPVQPPHQGLSGNGTPPDDYNGKQ